MAMRRSTMTLWPSRASMRRISRFLPSLRTISSQVLSPCVFSRLHAAGPDVAIAEPDALEQLLDVLAVGLAGHLDQIGLLDAEARMHEPIGQVAVVGQQQQALAVLVEPADGVDALADVRHQIDGPRPAAGIVVGAEVAARLVDQPVDELLAVQRLAIHAHGIAGFDLRAQLADDAAIRPRPGRGRSVPRNAAASRRRHAPEIC